LTEGGGIVVVVECEHRGQEGVSLSGDAPATGMRDFPKQPMDVKSFQEAGDAGALAAAGHRVGGRLEEVASEVAVGEAAEQMFAAHHSGKETNVVSGQRIEAAIGALGVTDGLGESAQLSMGRRGIVYDGQGVQVAGVGGAAEFGVAIEVGDPFGHGEPVHDVATPATPASADLEFTGSVDGRLDAQNASVLVVHLDGVLFHAVSDAHPGPTGLVVRSDVTGELGVELSAKEGHDVFGAEVRGGVLEQRIIETGQGGGVFEQNVGGVLGLLSDPVIVHFRQQPRVRIGPG